MTHTGRPKSLCLFGETRLGKTLWARSLGTHVYFGGLFCLDEDIENASYAVFDDMGGLKFVPSHKFWLGGQNQFYATDKYRGKQLITWGKPTIWLSQFDPRIECDVDIAWLEGNCEFVHIRDPIFRANKE